MVRRRPFSEAPPAVKELVAELEKDGDYLVYEDEHQQPVVSIVSAKARRQEGARKLRTLLDSFPSYPYSEEEVNADIEEAIQATKGQYPGDAHPKVDD
ncbi:MAG: hypothetical protein O7G87_06170 [bacterium]|nr:hypothetical protein [bacterium]